MNEELKAVIQNWRDDLNRRPSGYLNSELTLDDWGVISEAVWSRFSEDEYIILHIFNSFNREFITGHRCSVCGRTDAQNKAIDYDCVREC